MTIVNEEYFDDRNEQSIKEDKDGEYQDNVAFRKKAGSGGFKSKSTKAKETADKNAIKKEKIRLQEAQNSLNKKQADLDKRLKNVGSRTRF